MVLQKRGGDNGGLKTGTNAVLETGSSGGVFTNANVHVLLTGNLARVVTEEDATEDGEGAHGINGASLSDLACKPLSANGPYQQHVQAPSAPLRPSPMP